MNLVSFSIPSSSSTGGVDFVEAADYFPEASSIVLAHVMDEADTNVDGYLSDTGLELFKKVRDHTEIMQLMLKMNIPQNHLVVVIKQGTVQIMVEWLL